MTEDSSQPKRQITEEVRVKGTELVDFIKKMLAAGNVRRLIIHKPGGETLMELPLTTGLAASGILTLMAPVFAAAGALGALMAGVKVEIIRSGDSGDD